MEAGQHEVSFTRWPHAPLHLFVPNAIYFLTASTYNRIQIFNTPERRDFLLDTLLERAARFQWRLEAWAVMSNHYHFVARAPEDARSLQRFVTSLHSKTAVWINRQDGAPGRKVWYQYRDTCLTYERSYLARLNYVHHNPVKHGLVERAEDYPWCSKKWFLENADAVFQETLRSVEYDRINVEDDF